MTALAIQLVAVLIALLCACAAGSFRKPWRSRICGLGLLCVAISEVAGFCV
ncbi:MAG: hypothetical protein K8U57_38525 [Planctomycetes bacterium]|nr:hypothetical protein [Planctomycetota bacterium]